ncbi:MAG: LytTR family transcriptional regulator DNA-binding domain-containing protein [Bacteroidota bacterium]
MLRAVLVDDEPLARTRMRMLLAEAASEVEVVGEAGSGREAVPLIHEAKPDVLFLDIQMPVLDGFDVLDLLAPPRPHVVFVTAYDEFALRAFEVHALDYLTKPVRAERLARSLARVAAMVAAGTPDAALDGFQATRATAPLRRLTLRAGRSLRVAEVGEVLAFEARAKLVFARHAGRDYPVDFTIQELETRLPAERFVRVHRAVVVNVEAMRELVPWFSGTYRLRLKDGTELPVSRRRVRALKTRLGG